MLPTAVWQFSLPVPVQCAVHFLLLPRVSGEVTDSTERETHRAPPTGQTVPLGGLKVSVCV